MARDTRDRLTWLRKTLEDADPDLMREMLKVFAGEPTSAGADAICVAGFRERRAERALVAVIAGCYVRGVSTRIPGSAPTCVSMRSPSGCVRAGVS